MSERDTQPDLQIARVVPILVHDAEFSIMKVNQALVQRLQLTPAAVVGNFCESILPKGQGRFAFTNRAEFLEEAGNEYDAVMQALQWIFSELQLVTDKVPEVGNFSRRTEEIRTQLEFIIQGTDKNIVYWIEHRGEFRRGRTGQSHIILQATPIDISQILKQALFEEMDTVVLTSATLAVAAGPQGGNFDYIRQRLGMAHARELVVPSHFDYANQAILYVPPDLPPPPRRRKKFAGCWLLPRGALSAFSPVTPRCARYTTCSKASLITPCCCKAPLPRMRFWSNSGSLPMRFCLPPAHFGRAWMCKESS